MKIVAYTYEASVHCPECAMRRFGRIVPNAGFVVPYGATDSEGNPVHPVFDTDEFEFKTCDDCFEAIA